MSGFLVLWRHAIRRDRVTLPIWILGIALIGVGAIAASTETYGDEAERKEILTLAIASRSILIFRGTPDGADFAPFAFFLIWAWLAMMAGLMSTFLAVRHTRADEERGRAELIGSTPAGRTTPMVVTLVHGVTANVIVGVLIALGFTATGLPVVGSVVAGLALAVVGISFLAIGLAASELVRTARGANMIGVVAVVTAYLLRGLGDAAGTPSADLLHVAPAWPSFLSPIVYGQFTRAYVADDLVPLLVPLALAAVLVAGVFGLRTVRDQGASLLRERPGRAAAGPVLSSSLGLAWRLSITTLISWSAGAFVVGLLATSLTGLLDRISDVDALPDVLANLQAALGAASVEQSLVAVFYGIGGVLASCCAVQMAIRARQEESRGSAETLLATPVGKVRWLVEYWIVGAILVVVVLAVGVGGSLVGLAGAADPAGLVPIVLQGAVAQVPAALVFLGVTLFVFVWLPNATIGVGWALVSVLSLIGIFGPILGAPEWLTSVSPFTHTPVAAGPDTDWSGGAWLAAVAVVTGAAAIVSMRRRELVPGD